MATFIMLTRLNPDAVRSPRDLEREAMKRVREECPDVEWLNSYAVWAIRLSGRVHRQRH